jgi:AcrR family transcriptional regulator
MSIENSETKTRILQTCVEMLEQHKGKGVRMGDIAKQAGVSRQAVYLHFASRSDLLEATTKFLDQKLDVDSRLAPSRAAESGAERLALFVECWGGYIPEIYGVAKALLSMLDNDEAAAKAWKDRMLAMRDGCKAAIDMLHAEDNLGTEWSTDIATDSLWTMLSVPNWENFILECGWSHSQYIERLQTLTRLAFVKS